MNNGIITKEKKYKKKIHKFNPKTLLYTKEYSNMTSEFTCGEEPFDSYLNEEALEDRLNGGGVTYIVIDQDENRLIAYYTISTSTVHFVDNYDFEYEDIPDDEKRKHYSPISAIIINMFAVNNIYQDCIYEGEVVSAKVLESIIGKIYTMSTDIIGAKMIILCSVPDAVDFYKKSNFEELPSIYTLFDHIDLDGNKPMFLTLHES